MKKFLSLLITMVLAVTVACSLTGCGASEISLEDGTLTIGFTDYAPMNYFDDKAEKNYTYKGKNLVGFDTELAQEVCKILNVKAKFIEINWDTKVTGINAREFDCIWNGMTITEELQNALSITESYLENKQVVVCQASQISKYTDKESILNATEILVESGSAGEDAVKKVLGDENKSKMLGITAQKDTLLEVKTSSNKIAIIDKTMADVLVGEGTSYSELRIVDVGFELEQFGIAFRKSDSSSMEKVNNAIKTLKQNGKFDQLRAKYFA